MEVPSLKNYNPTGCKCVFRVKTRQMGPLIDLELNLLLRGYTPLSSLDYKEIFSAVVKQATIRSCFDNYCDAKLVIKIA